MAIPSFGFTPPFNTSGKTLCLYAENLHKRFVLHHQGGIELTVFQGISLGLYRGEAVALYGASGSGKSTLMRSLYGNYRINQGQIWIQHRDSWCNLPDLFPHELIKIRQTTLGYVSQFLRVIPRVPALEVVADPLLQLGVAPDLARSKAKQLLDRLNIPDRLWTLSPTTFSGGEKQRINLARSFMVDYPILLLDEPTAALDAINRAIVVEMLLERKKQGTAILGIFHDDDARKQICDSVLEVMPTYPGAIYPGELPVPFDPKIK